MSDARLAPTNGLTPRPGRDGALDAALDRLAPGRLPDRPDNPDLGVTAVRRLAAVAAQYAPFPEALDPRLRTALESRGLSQLYTHQAEAIDHALSGRHVVVITPTASGKTLCYNAPVLHSILQDSSSRALYLFPTKALAQDQLAELQTMCEALDASTGEKIGVFTYDGDTPQDARRTDSRSRPPGAEQPGHAAFRHPAASSHAGRNCSKIFATSSSTSCTRTGACLAAISATCCDAFAEFAGTTGRIRCSCVRPRRSRIRESSPSG